MWRDVPALEDDLDQGTACSPVPVFVRVNRLELRMRERRLDERRQCLVVAEGAEILEEGVHFLGRGRHEVRAAGVVVVAADPVLLRPDLASDLGPVRRRHEDAVDLDDLRYCDPLLLGRALDRRLHRVDVGEDFECGLRCSLPGVVGHLGSGEGESVDLHTFDLGGGDRLGAQQQARERSEPWVRVLVQRLDCSIRFGDHTGD